MQAAATFRAIGVKCVEMWLRNIDTFPMFIRVLSDISAWDFVAKKFVENEIVVFSSWSKEIASWSEGESVFEQVAMPSWLVF